MRIQEENSRQEQAHAERIGQGIQRFFRAHPFLWLALAAVAGIWAGDFWPLPAVWVAGSGCLLALAFTRRPRPWLPPALLAALALTSFAGVQALLLAGLASFPAARIMEERAEGVHVELRGEVLDAARLFGGGGFQVPLRLEAVRLAEGWRATRHRVMLRAMGKPPACGARVRFSGNLSLPERPRNPGGFDYGRYLFRQGYVGLVTAGEADVQEVLEGPRGRRLKRLALQTREWMARRLSRDLEGEPEKAAVLTAMTLGLREETPPDIEEAFQQSGTLHIFAVSGLHIGIFGMIAWYLLKPLGLRRARLALILIPSLFFYAYVTGWRPSAVRAATMASIYLGGFLVSRTPNLLNSLGLAALGILAWDSNQLFLPGFQLSFMVLTAIALLAQRLRKPFHTLTYPDPFVPPVLVGQEVQFYHRAARWTVNLFAVSAAAWLGSLPLMLVYFQIVTPVAILANGILIPLAFAILFTAALSLFSAVLPLMGWANVLFNNANLGLVSALVGAAQWFAALPAAHQEVAARPSWLRAPCEITVLDLPRGGAAQHLWLRGWGDAFVDCGHARMENAVLAPYFRHAGVEPLRWLLVTHADADHISAGPWLMENVRPDLLYEPVHPGRGASMRSVNRTAESLPVPQRGLAAGDRWSEPGVDDAGWEVLYPPRERTFLPGAADDQALVLRLHYQGWRVLFLSDAGFFTERWLLEAGVELQSDVVIKGHHAADVDGQIAFLEAVNPKILVAEATNPPAAPWRAWAKAHGIAVFDQRLTGAVRLELSRRQCRARSFLTDQVTFLKRAL